MGVCVRRVVVMISPTVEHVDGLVCVTVCCGPCLAERWHLVHVEHLVKGVVSLHDASWSMVVQYMVQYMVQCQ